MKAVQDKSYRKAYNLAKYYAFSLKRIDSEDIVHDAYLKWYVKTGKNLFNEHWAVIGRVVKNTFMNNIRKRLFMYNGILHSKQFFTKDETRDGYQAYEFKVDSNPLEQLIQKEQYTLFQLGLGPIESRIADYLRQGYRQNEIAVKLNMSTQVISSRARKVYKRVREVIK